MPFNDNIEVNNNKYSRLQHDLSSPSYLIVLLLQIEISDSSTPA